MPLSLSEIASNCLSLGSSFSVLYDFFGYWFGPEHEISLKEQLELAEGKGININLIRVGSGNFGTADMQEIDNALYFARSIYAKVDLCIRGIRWQNIASPGDYATINDGGEAHNLTDDYNGPNGGYLDVFAVRLMIGAGGWAPVVGPCSKDDKDTMTGCVISLAADYWNWSGDTTGVVLAHEMGHYLGASQNDPGNHHPSASNFMNANAAGGATDITTSQGNEMKSHCYVKDGC